jgi:hypothetical protein
VGYNADGTGNKARIKCKINSSGLGERRLRNSINCDQARRLRPPVPAACACGQPLFAAFNFLYSHIEHARNKAMSATAERSQSRPIKQRDASERAIACSRPPPIG